jgi:protein-S-isoprenylcysteine O-methyltransferase Ste14
MDIYPPLQFSLLNGFLLTLPMLILRFGIPALIKKEALAELDYFPPVRGLEKLALKIYFISNTFLIFSPILAKVESMGKIKIAGWLIYLMGVLVLGISLVDYCRQDGLKTEGIYKYSRNPICMGYFLIFLGTTFLISSWFHLALTIIYQISVHWLILSEERWCLGNFGNKYQEYMDCVPRYFI